MKRLVLLVCCILLVSAPALAQVPGVSVGFGVHGNVTNFKLGPENPTNFSITNPRVSLQDVYGLGLGGGIHLDIDIPILSFRVSGDYISISPDDAKLKTIAQRLLPGLNIAIEGGKIEMWSGNVNAKLVILPIPVVHPYVTGGVGLAKLNFETATVLVNGAKLPVPGGDYAKFLALDSKTLTTANVGAGVDLALGGLALFGELKLNWIFTDPKTSSQVPVGTVGITF